MPRKQRKSWQARIANSAKPRHDIPACPRCHCNRVVLYGSKPIQRYLCAKCSRTFTERTKGYIQKLKFDLVCYRCGSNECLREGPGSKKYGGYRGKCLKCRRVFQQGGRADLERYHLILRHRVNQLGVPADMAEEIYQQASLDVLEGRGYCWNINLDRLRAWKETRGPHPGKITSLKGVESTEAGCD